MENKKVFDLWLSNINSNTKKINEYLKQSKLENIIVLDNHKKFYDIAKNAELLPYELKTQEIKQSYIYNNNLIIELYY